MMIDQDIAYASPSTVWRVLTHNRKRSLKGTGFEQPIKAHEHWHTDISYIKIKEKFYFLICVLDGFSCTIVHWDLRESMDETNACLVQQRAAEFHPNATPRMITDNGKQFTGKEFKMFLAHHNFPHAKTSPYYPQSNGKIERFHSSIKSECIKRKYLHDSEHAKAIIGDYVNYYNNERLHSAIGYVTPKDKLEGKAEQKQKNRDQKLAKRRLERKETFRKCFNKNNQNISENECQNQSHISAAGF